MFQRYQMVRAALLVLAVTVLVAPSVQALDTPAIGAGVSGHAKQTITITAGPSGLPNGFEVWWMDRSQFMANGGQWPADATTDMGAASFTGEPTLNTFERYTTFKLGPFESIMVEIGDLFGETGVAGTTDELNYAELYYFTAFGLDASGNRASDLSVTVSASTTASRNCTYTQGYWKNHEKQWPVGSLFLGSVSYTKAQLLIILDEPVEGNGLISLAHQLIAAKLNIANGADPTAALATIAAADALIGALVVPPIGLGYLAPATTSPLTQVLDDYNNGVIGPGHCGTVATKESTWGGIKALYR